MGRKKVYPVKDLDLYGVEKDLLLKIGRSKKIRVTKCQIV